MKKSTKFFAIVLGVCLLACLFLFGACNSHEHEMSAIAAKAATCTQAGNSAYWYCEGCGKYFSDEEGTEEIALEDTVVAAIGHDLQKKTVGEGQALEHGGEEYYSCSRCGTAFADAAGKTPVSLLSKMFTDQYIYAADTMNGPNMFASTTIGGDFDSIDSQQFVLRFFMGFDYDLAQLGANQPVEVHMNIHRSGADPEYWQFVFRYYPTPGFETVIFETGSGAGRVEQRVDQKWGALTKEQGGLWLLLQRSGDMLACYAEDEQGTPELIFSVTGFSTGAIFQMRIAHFAGYFADDTHGGVIRDMEIALDTISLTAERTAYGKLAA